MAYVVSHLIISTDHRLSRSVSCINCKVEVSYNYIPIVAKYITIPG